MDSGTPATEKHDFDDFFGEVKFGADADASNTEGSLGESSAEATSRYDVDSEVGFKVPGSTGFSADLGANDSGPNLEQSKTSRPSLSEMLAGKGPLRGSSSGGVLEMCAAQIKVVGTPLHARVEKKATSLTGALSKLAQFDPDFKLACKKFSEVFESLSGTTMRLKVIEFADLLRETYEMRDDQAVFCVLLTCTSRARKLGEKSLLNADMTLRIVGSIVSAEDHELVSRLRAVSNGKLEGDLSGGSRKGAARFSSGSESNLASLLLIAWLEFLSKTPEDDSVLTTEKAKLWMTSAVWHELWQKVSRGSLEDVALTVARFADAWDVFDRFEMMLGVRLLPTDAYGKAKMFWPGLHPKFLEELKQAARMKALLGKPVRWLQEVPVFEDWTEYEEFLTIGMTLWTANGQQQLPARQAPARQRRPSLVPPPGATMDYMSNPGNPPASGRYATDAAKKKKICWHFKKFGECKFGEASCKSGDHPPEFMKSATAVLSAGVPVSGVPAVLPAGVPSPAPLNAADAATRDCRRCNLTFTESTSHWVNERKCTIMPTHCEACRKIRHQERLAEKQQNAAMPAAVDEPDPEPDAADAQGSDSWDEVLKFAEGDDFEFMIADLAEVDDESVARSLESDFDSVALECPDGQGETLAQLNSPCPYVGQCPSPTSSEEQMLVAALEGRGVEDCSDSDSGSGDGVLSPAWGSLDSNGLAVNSMTVKSVFGDFMQYQDRRFQDSGVRRLIQMCIVDAQGCMMAVDSEDMAEVCLPGWEVSKGVDVCVSGLSDMLFSQTGICADSDRFAFAGYAELSDDFGDKAVWYYFSLKASVRDVEVAMTEEGSPVSWLEQFEWSRMARLREAEASCFFDLRESAAMVGFRHDVLDSDEYEHAVGTPEPVDRSLEVFVNDNPFGVLAVDQDGPTDQEQLDLIAALEEAQQLEDKPDCSKCILGRMLSEYEQRRDVPVAGFTGVVQFGDILAIVIENAVVGDALASVWSASRSWRPRQPSVQKAVRAVLKSSAIRTPVRRVEALASVVPVALDFLRGGCSQADLAAVLEAQLEDDVKYATFSSFDYEVAAVAALGMASNITDRLYASAVVSVGEMASELSLVCSGSRRDVRHLATCIEVLGDARKLGVKKQLTMHESLSRASASVMFSSPSYRYTDVHCKSPKDKTGVELVGKGSFFGGGSAEPEQ